MVKKLVLVAAACLLIASAVSAEDVCDPSQGEPAQALAVDLEAVPLADGESASDEGSPEEPQYMSVFCEADCQSGSVSCTGNSWCNAYDRSCPGERGRVVCDGNTTLCPTECQTGGGGCTIFECRSGCREPGCISVCVDTETCECETICM